VRAAVTKVAVTVLLKHQPWSDGSEVEADSVEWNMWQRRLAPFRAPPPGADRSKSVHSRSDTHSDLKSSAVAPKQSRAGECGDPSLICYRGR
jgi:hypothetical protein